MFLIFEITARDDRNKVARLTAISSLDEAASADEPPIVTMGPAKTITTAAAVK